MYRNPKNATAALGTRVKLTDNCTGGVLDIIDVLQSDISELPKKRSKSDVEFRQFLESAFTKYYDSISGITATDYCSVSAKRMLQDIQIISTEILKTIDALYVGSQSDAMQILDSVLSKYKSQLDALVSLPIRNQEIPDLYRIRVLDRGQFSKVNLFHIPFELRPKVKSYRYSVPGVPMLYLGGSSYCCWQELDNPHMDSICIAKFKVQDHQTLKVLNFGYRPALIAALLDKHQSQCTSKNGVTDFAMAQVLLWPLITACSVMAVKDDQTYFISEYLIPQLLLQWITKQVDFDGIRYFSTKIYGHIDNPIAACNYVLPIKTLGFSGHCAALKGKLEYTEPVHWDVARASLGSVRLPRLLGRDFKIHLSSGLQADYKDTEFYQMEQYLETLPMAGI